MPEKYLEGILNSLNKNKVDDSVNQNFVPNNGISIKKSYCCDAPVKYSSGGIRAPVCSRCGKPYEELVFK
jgi:hypothetical protein